MHHRQENKCCSAVLEHVLLSGMQRGGRQCLEFSVKRWIKWYQYMCRHRLKTPSAPFQTKWFNISDVCNIYHCPIIIHIQLQLNKKAHCLSKLDPWKELWLWSPTDVKTTGTKLKRRVCLCWVGINGAICWWTWMKPYLDADHNKKGPQLFKWNSLFNM